MVEGSGTPDGAALGNLGGQPQLSQEDGSMESCLMSLSASLRIFVNVASQEYIFRLGPDYSS